MTGLVASRTISVLAALTALSTFIVDPITQTLLIAHLVMIGIIASWLFMGMPRSIILSISTALALLTYVLAISELVNLGDRFLNESIKYTILIFFTCAMFSSPYFNRNALSYFSIALPIALILYVMLSSDPYIYGGRLGIAIGVTSDDAMISANTLGFAINICAATILGRNPRLFVYMSPIFLFLLYLTFSRGALLSAGIMGLAYFIRQRKAMYVAILAIVSSVVFIDINMDLITTTFRLDDTTGSGRTVLYQMMFADMSANPISFLLGHGPGNINFEIYAGKIIVSAHNGYLEMLYNFGAIGVLAVFFFLSRIVRNYWLLPMDSLLYAVLLGSYALSEDLMGAHNLMPIGLMLGLILYDFNLSAKQRAGLQRANGVLNLRGALR